MGNKKMWLSSHRTSVRTSVRTLQVGISRNEFLPSPREFCPLLFQKIFRNDWKNRICQLTKCLVDFRGRPFDFWGVMGDFRKNVLQADFERKKACKWIPGKKIILQWKSLMTYNAEKNLIPLYVGEEISNSREVWEKTLPQYKLNQYNHPYPTPPQTSNGHVNHLEGEERNGFDTLVNVIHQQNGWRAFIMWWFTRLKFCILRLKVRR